MGSQTSLTKRAGSQIDPRSLLALRKATVVSTVLGVCLTLACTARATLASGIYRTLPGATVEERGDRVANGSRVVPFCATLTFDLNAAQPSLTAFIPNAVLEGGDPFALTVHSAYDVLLTNGTYRFMGDYLRDLYPAGTQYLFDWSFSTSTNGQVFWNGIIGWAGGHLWQVTISNLTILPVPKLDIVQAGAQITVSWPATYEGYALEQAASLPATDWSPVTNAVTMTGNRFSVTVEGGAAQRYFRLREF